MIHLMIITSVAFVLYVQTGVFLLWKNRGGRLNRWFSYAAFYLAISALILLVAMTYNSTIHPHLAEFAGKAIWALLPALIFRITALLTGVPADGRQRDLIYLLFFMVGLALMLGYLTLLVSFWANPTLMEEDPAVFYLLDRLLFVLLGFSGVVLLYIFFVWSGRKSQSVFQMRFLLLAYALLPLALTFLIVGELFPHLYPFRLFRLPYVFFLPWLLAMVFGFVRYRFFLPDPARSSEILLDKLKQIIFYTNTKGQIIASNPYSLQLSGYSINDLKGKGIDCVFNDSLLVEEMIDRAIQKGFFSSRATTMSLKNGIIVPVVVSAILLEDEYRDKHGLFFYGEDSRESFSLMQEIRVRTQTEASLLAMGEDLESEVEDRTAELTHSVQQVQMLMEDRKAAEDAVKSELAELKVMLDEVNHRVRKNTELVLSILDASSRLNMPSDLAGCFASLHGQIQTMNKVLRHTTADSGYQKVDFLPVIQWLVYELHCTRWKDSEKHIFLSASGNTITAELAIPLALAINEVLSVLVARIDLASNASNNLAESSLHLHYNESDSSTLNIKIEYRWEKDTSSLVNQFNNPSELFPLADLLVKDQLGGSLVINKNAEALWVEAVLAV